MFSHNQTAHISTLYTNGPTEYHSLDWGDITIVKLHCTL